MLRIYDPKSIVNYCKTVYTINYTLCISYQFSENKKVTFLKLLSFISIFSKFINSKLINCKPIVSNGIKLQFKQPESNNDIICNVVTYTITAWGRCSDIYFRWNLKVLSLNQYRSALFRIIISHNGDLVIGVESTASLHG